MFSFFRRKEVPAPALSAEPWPLPSEGAAANGFILDPVQEQTLGGLDRHLDNLRLGLLTSKGVFLWGPPGRGKTFMMDCVFEAAQCPKTRIHFFEFFRTLYRALHVDFKGRTEPVKHFVKDRFGDEKLVCFDEFHVHDIADAMLLQAFLEALFDLDLFAVFTSNYPPDGLLQDSRFHERFARGIDLLQSNLDVISVDHGEDYRDLAVQVETAYFHPLNAVTNHRLKAAFAALEGQDHIPWSLKDECLDPLGRGVQCIAKGEKAIWISFDSLCAEARSYIDYLNLAANFEAAVVSGVTEKALKWPSVVQRFVWLIDVLYDKKIKFVLSSERDIVEMLSQAGSVPDLNRTLSRLNEMSAWID